MTRIFRANGCLKILKILDFFDNSIPYYIYMEKFQVTVLGCGSALPTMRHNGSAHIVNIREKYFLVDCAEGTQLALRRNHVHLNRMQTVFITHMHGDHCFGLMGLISTQNLLGRTAPLHIYGPADLEPVFQPQIDYFCPNLDFEVIFHAVDTKVFAPIYEDHSLTVFSIPLQHRIRCCGYLFREKPLLPHIRREAIERYDIPVWQINNIKAGQDFTLPDGSIIPNEALVTPAEAPRSYAYCSDTIYKPDIADYLEGVDLLYHEATYADDNLQRAEKYHHTTARQAAQIALAAHAKRLLIGHFSQRYEDENLLLREAQEVFPNTLLADEGLTLDV